MFRSFRRSSAFHLAFAVLFMLVVTSYATAHFVWIDSEPTPDGLLIRSGFGEPDGWDPDLAARMGKSTFWVRRDGKTKPVAVPLDKKEQEYRTTLPGETPGTVLAATDFGVIQFGGNPPAWLRYTAKHLVGTPETWNDATPTDDLRIEVLAKREGDHVTLRVLHLGRPLGGAVIKAYPADEEKTELTTDEDGVAQWKVSTAGKYSLYVGTTTPTAGELDGKKYDVLKDYATLTFRLP
jgi:hypothetical protein